MHLKKILDKRHMSQSKLSMLAQVNATHLNRAINGKIQFYPAWRKRIAQALEMDEDEVFPEYKEKGVK